MGDESIEPEIIVWQELRVPSEEPSDQWNSHFQPMIQALGHDESSWARIPERPDTVLMATLWCSNSALKDFRDSPSAQLFTEDLGAKGISLLTSYESIYSGNWFQCLCRSYVQLFQVYFQAPITEEQEARTYKVRGMCPAALGPSVPRKHHITRHLPEPVCTTQTEHLNGAQAQLVLWPHFWANAKKAEWRHTETYILSGSVAIGTQTIMEKFIGNLKELGAIEWREEFCKFKRIPYL
ncbi:hypothetical protein N7522_004619 [Penicillium canescens]|nr:hypothetical protein N7522_004619 [Penicillium canescens]